MKLSIAALLSAVVAVVACKSTTGEGLEPAALPTEVRSDYDVFAQRCSKCHSLARPLQSGIEDDVFWEFYVARMRRMPGSGISLEDERRILRFLKYYAAEQRKRRSSTDMQTAKWGNL